MTPQQFTARIAQITSKRLAIAALSLGLAATALAPMSAVAAPLRPEVDPGGSHFAKPDLMSTLSMPNGTVVGAGQQARFILVSKNQGIGPGVPVKLGMGLPQGTKNVAVQSPAGFNCTTAPGKFFKTITVDVICEGGKIAAGASATVVVDATMPLTPGDFGVIAGAITVGNAKDTNENNNGAGIQFQIQ